jgi:hypothetical protein
MKKTIMISIPKNDYKAETEVREDVLRFILSYFVSDARQEDPRGFGVRNYDHVYLRDIEFIKEREGVTTEVRRRDESWIKSNLGIGLFVTRGDYSLGFRSYTKVRKCEMVAAFEIMENAGYLLYHSIDDANIHWYTWSCKPLDESKRNYYDMRFIPNID